MPSKLHTLLQSYLPTFWGLLLEVALPSWGLHEIHDDRYTVMAETFTPDQSVFYGGFQTRWVADGDFLGGFKFGINDRFEVGSRIGLHTLNRFDQNFVLLDLGGKYALDGISDLQSDFILGINNNRGGGAIFTYSRTNAYTNRFHAVFETRLGVFNAVTNGNWATLEVGAHPQFQIASPIALKMGLISTSDLRHPIHHFQLGLLPGLLIGATSYLQIFGECGVDVIGDDGIRLSIMGIGHF